MATSVAVPAMTPSEREIPPALLKVCFALFVINAVFFPAAYFQHCWIYEANGQGIPTDFINVFAAGKLVLWAIRRWLMTGIFRSRSNSMC